MAEWGHLDPELLSGDMVGNLGRVAFHATLDLDGTGLFRTSHSDLSDEDAFVRLL
jgi:hypothetical protein